MALSPVNHSNETNVIFMHKKEFCNASTFNDVMVIDKHESENVLFIIDFKEFPLVIPHIPKQNFQ